MLDTEANIKRFEELMGKVNREGIDKLMNHIRNSDFYTAPASTRFHLACPGGLLQHSLNVYDCLMAKKAHYLWSHYLKEHVGDESITLISLMHDLCKADTYKLGYKNQKTYDKAKVAAANSSQVKRDELGEFIWETIPKYEMFDPYPLGHGEKSVILLQEYIELTDEEIFAIRWHMGFTEDNSQYNSIGTAMEQWPIVLAIHEADLEASKLMEGVDGNLFD